jgi:TatD DNase family protein
MIDAHCHLQFHSFQNNYDEVAKRAFTAGITKIINAGTKIDSSQKAIDYANVYPEMYAVIGIHPHHADKVNVNPKFKTLNSNNKKQEEGWIGELEEMAKDPKVIGIGEIGLDYFNYQSNGIVDPKLQKEVFIKQIKLAYKLHLPMQIHNRQAGEEIVQILEDQGNLLQDPPGIFHCFAGSMKVLDSILQMGFYIGIDGNVTYKGLAPGETVDLKDVVRYVPLDRLVIETDSPFLAPVPHRGELNEPAHVIITGQYIAKLKGVPFAQLVGQTTKNVYNVFTKLK